MYSVALLTLVFMTELSPVYSSSSLTVTCELKSNTDLVMSVRPSSGSLTDYARIYINGESSTDTSITSATPIPVEFSSRNFDQYYQIILLARSEIELLSDVNEKWKCTRNLNAVPLVTSTATNVEESSDGESSTGVTATFTIAVLDVSGNAFSGAQTIGTTARLTITQGANFQSDFWFYVDKVEAKTAAATSYTNFFDTTSKCSADVGVMQDPSVKTSQISIFVEFPLFRFATVDAAAQDIVYKATVQPCADQSTCQSAACENSTDPARRKRRSASNSNNDDDLEPVSLFATATVLPTGAIATSSKTTGNDDNDTVLEDGLCFGRAPVYAGAAILVALLISLMCFGFLFVALKRRRNQKQVVEYPSPQQSVASVHGLVSSGKLSTRG